MEEQNENLGVDKYTQDRVDKGIKALLEEKELKIKWQKELEENESFKEYLKGFYLSPSSTAIHDYVREKYLWHKFGDMYQRKHERERTKWIDAAYKGLEAILQKKLFDLQCLWRANEIKLEGVRICKDFNKIEEDIFNCSFLEPITESDIAMYQDFLSKGDLEYNRYSFGEEWQNYNGIKIAYQSDNSECNMPEWYEFHNMRTGNTRLFLLPDTRGDQEEFYMNIYRENQRKINSAKENIVAPNIDKRPFLHIHKPEVVEFIVKTFDTKEAQNGHRYYSQAHSSYENNEYYEHIFRELIEAKEFVSIESNYNFKDALEKAHQAYRCRKISEYLPFAYEQYLFNKQMGLTIAKDDSLFSSTTEMRVEMILDARELNGEPRDFNF